MDDQDQDFLSKVGEEREEYVASVQAHGCGARVLDIGVAPGGSTGGTGGCLEDSWPGINLGIILPLSSLLD